MFDDIAAPFEAAGSTVGQVATNPYAQGKVLAGGEGILTLTQGVVTGNPSTIGKGINQIGANASGPAQYQGPLSMMGGKGMTGPQANPALGIQEYAVGADTSQGPLDFVQIFIHQGRPTPVSQAEVIAATQATTMFHEQVAAQQAGIYAQNALAGTTPAVGHGVNAAGNVVTGAPPVKITAIAPQVNLGLSTPGSAIGSQVQQITQGVVNAAYNNFQVLTGGAQRKPPTQTIIPTGGASTRQ